MTDEERFDRLLKAMASGEPPTGTKESEGVAVAKHRDTRDGKRRA